MFYAGDIKVIVFGGTKVAMTYNTEFECGTLSGKYTNYRACAGKCFGNGRDYEWRVANHKFYLKCMTNTLPSDGKPTVQCTITYI